MDLTRELATACALQPGDRVLDLACGVGSTASYLSREWGADVCGLDASPEFLAEAKGGDEDVEWVLGRADALPFPDGRFDCVFAECFLSGCADRAVVLREVRRVLRPGGRLALSDMYLREPAAAPLTDLAPAACLRGARNKDDTLAAIEDRGFRVTVWEDRSEALKGLMASLILAYGSAAAFWEAAAGGTGNAGACGDTTGGSGGGRGPDTAGSAAARAAALSAARPGYYLLVAEATALPSAIAALGD
jgi:SAM-dependent methyltransferase